MLQEHFSGCHIPDRDRRFIASATNDLGINIAAWTAQQWHQKANTLTGFMPSNSCEYAQTFLAIHVAIVSTPK